MKKLLVILLIYIFPLGGLRGAAQIGEHRSIFSVGASGGYAMTRMPFYPSVSQTWAPGYTFGLSGRYVCEKYFKMICAIDAEVNLTQAGWKEKIIDIDDNPVLNPRTGQNDAYHRKLTYIQIPLLCHLAVGKEQKGVNFFFKGGPQFGCLISDKVSTNFSCDPTASDYGNFTDRANKTYAQDTIDIKNRFDYGIAAGIGLEASINRVGHFLVEGRFYYGLGNIFSSAKKDYFQRSNQNAIVIKLTYLFDVTGRNKEEKK